MMSGSTIINVTKPKVRKKRTVYPKFPKQVFSKSFLNDGRKKIFIENDVELRWEIQELVEMYLNQMNGLLWDDFFFKTITNARHVNGEELFKDICEADDIVLWTAFVQDSGYMFDTMAKMALKMNITGKRIFIFREQENMFRSASLDKKLFKKAAKLNAFYFETDDEHCTYDNRYFDLYDPKKD